MDHDQAELPQVGEDDPDHAEREIDVRCDIRHGGRRAGQLEDAHVLGGQGAEIRDRGLRGHDGRHQVERFPGVPGPALGQGIGPDHGSGLGVEPPFIVGRHGSLAPAA